jgi:hypothetical protein
VNRAARRPIMNHMYLSFLPLLVVACATVPIAEDPKTVKIRLDAGCTIHFLNGVDARNAIVESKVDPYFRLMSKADVECRLNRSLPDETQVERVEMLKRQYVAAVKTWDKVRIAKVMAACKVVLPIARSYSSKFVPRVWKFVLTDGTEESEMASTRNDTVVLSMQEIDGVVGRSLGFLVAHETVHLFTRHYPERRGALYKRLGFRKVGAIHGGELASRLLTNPDAPFTEHVIRVKHGGVEVDAVPMLFSEVQSKVKDPEGLLSYLRIGLFVAKSTDGKWQIGERLAVGDIDTFFDNVRTVPGFLEQVGENTPYVIHPEEILAENLGHLLSGEPVKDQKPAGKKLMDDLGAILKAED